MAAPFKIAPNTKHHASRSSAIDATSVEPFGAPDERPTSSLIAAKCGGFRFRCAPECVPITVLMIHAPALSIGPRVVAQMRFAKVMPDAETSSQENYERVAGNRPLCARARSFGLVPWALKIAGGIGVWEN